MRISVTDRCNIRCNYCLPDTPVCFQPRAAILTFEEIENITRRAAGAAFAKLRFTGGEPLLRSGSGQLSAACSRIPGIDEVALTTNGVLLASMRRPV